MNIIIVSHMTDNYLKGVGKAAKCITLHANGGHSRAGICFRMRGPPLGSADVGHGSGYKKWLHTLQENKATNITHRQTNKQPNTRRY